MGTPAPPALGPIGAPTPDALVARDVELDAISRLLTGDPGVPGALVLEGEPGIGKTSLWERGVALGLEQGRRVLSTRASGAEAELPFAGLIDLLDDVGAEELDGVPLPQLRALNVALYREDPTGPAPEPQAIALGLLSALRLLAARHRLLIAIDDLQWLDRASEDALAYAVRRLGGEAVTILFARRPGPRSALEGAFAADTIGRLQVGQISLGATRQILARRLGLRLPHHLLRRVYDATLGNPLFALEVGRVLAGRDLDALDDDVPVPDHVDDLLGLRVTDLDAAVRRVLLALALDADLRVGQLRDLAGTGAVEAALNEGVVLLEGERVRASHPLLAAAAKRHATDQEKKELHRALAEVVTNDERRALHLALATVTEDDELAARVAAAARRAAARGATRLAAELGTHAVRLTPADAAASTARLLELGQHLAVAGEKQRLTDLLDGRVESLPAPGSRVTAYLLLTRGVVRDNEHIRDLLEKALAEADDDQMLRAPVLAELAENEAVVEVARIARADQRAMEAVASSGSHPLEGRGLALAALGWTRALGGHDITDVCAEYNALTDHHLTVSRSPERVAGQRLVWRGEVRAARDLLTFLKLQAEARAEPSSYALVRLHLCELELRIGNWDAAERLLDDWAASTDSALLHWPMYERCRALLHAGRGDNEEARRWASTALERADSVGVRWDWLEATRALALAAMLEKDLDEARRHLATVWEHTERERVQDPGVFPVGPDLVEVLAETDALDHARLAADRLAELARAQDHPWAHAAARRSAAIIDIAHDDYSDEAADALASAAAAYHDLGLAFDEARTLLVLGRAQRRARKWGAARETLERATAAFEAIGSTGWAEDARSELARVGARKPASEGRLTAAERRVAGLAAEGLSNKEIARTLVVTVNTVEFHLRNAYAKLGLRSRAQLAARLRDEGTDPGQMGARP